MYQKILVALDGSESSGRALSEALQLAARLHAEVRAVYVIDDPAIYAATGYFDPGALRQAMEEEASSVLSRARVTMDVAKVKGDTKTIDSIDVGGDVATALQQAAREYGAELAVLGTHGRRGIRRMVMGSVAEHYVRISGCPVLLIRSDKDDN